MARRVSVALVLVLGGCFVAGSDHNGAGLTTRPADAGSGSSGQACPPPVGPLPNSPPRGRAVIDGQEFPAIWHNVGNHLDGGHQDLDLVSVAMSANQIGCGVTNPAGVSSEGWWVWMMVEGSDDTLQPGEYPAGPFGSVSDGGLRATVSHAVNGPGTAEYGSVWLDALDCDHVEGHFLLNVAGGRQVEGRFNAPSCP